MSAHDLLKELLINAGTTGLKQKEITIALQNHTRAPEIRRILESWRKIGAVQKFRLEAGAFRPITIWRATTKLLEIEDEI